MRRKSTKIFYIIGVGSAGISLFHDIRNKFPNSMIIFIDDDASKSGTTIENMPVMAPIDDALSILNPNPTSEVIIAMPSAAPHIVRRIHKLLKQNNFTKIKILPSPLSSLETPHLIQTQEININDLLTRKTIMLPDKNALSYLEGKRVLITGAGGSIGTELAVQLLYAGVSRMYLLGHGEHSIYQITKKLLALQQRGVGEHTNCIPILCELTDSIMVQHTLSKLKADVIFHAAAFKHIDLVEDNATISIAINVFGTKNILQYAQETKVKQFVLLSTDKAVNPISIYGASKLISEEMTRRAANSTMKTSIMRFGNVIGSRGSVVPLFQEQIAMGGPLTITSPECKRYFMTISEACSLTLYALQLKNKEQFNQYILEMGEQISVLDLAKQMLDFYGLEAEKDIAFSFIGLRLGEKLSENLIGNGESREKSPIEHVYYLKKKPNVEYIKEFSILIKSLYSACFFTKKLEKNYRNTEFIIKTLKAHIPTFSHE